MNIHLHVRILKDDSGNGTVDAVGVHRKVLIVTLRQHLEGVPGRGIFFRDFQAACLNGIQAACNLFREGKRRYAEDAGNDLLHLFRIFSALQLNVDAIIRTAVLQAVKITQRILQIAFKPLDEVAAVMSLGAEFSIADQYRIIIHHIYE